MLERYTAHLYPNVQGRACCRCVRPAIGLNIPLLYAVKARDGNSRVTMRACKTLKNFLQILKLSLHQNESSFDLKHGSIILDILCRRSSMDMLGHLIGRPLDQLPNQWKNRISHDICFNCQTLVATKKR
jgi:hypothetical protein